MTMSLIQSNAINGGGSVMSHYLFYFYYVLNIGQNLYVLFCNFCFILTCLPSTTSEFVIYAMDNFWPE